jgi:beta-lactam-binding protein with PASTA domain
MAADEGGDIAVPDFSGKTMREVTEMCLHLGFEPLLVGSNLAVEQRPEAGTQVRRGAKVTVQFGTPPPAVKAARAHARSRR